MVSLRSKRRISFTHFNFCSICSRISASQSSLCIYATSTLDLHIAIVAFFINSNPVITEFFGMHVYFISSCIFPSLHFLTSLEVLIKLSINIKTQMYDFITNQLFLYFVSISNYLSSCFSGSEFGLLHSQDIMTRNSRACTEDDYISAILHNALKFRHIYKPYAGGILKLNNYVYTKCR